MYSITILHVPRRIFYKGLLLMRRRNLGQAHYPIFLKIVNHGAAYYIEDEDDNDDDTAILHRAFAVILGR